MPKTSPRIFFILGLIGENIFDQVHPTEQDKSTLPSSVLKMKTLDIHISIILALFEKILGSFAA